MPAVSATNAVAENALAALTVTVAVATLPVNPPPVHPRLKLVLPDVAVGVTLIVPLDASVPLQAPVAVQVVPALADQVRVTLWPAVIVVGLADSATIAGVGFTTGLETILLPPQPLKIRAPTSPLSPPNSARIPSMSFLLKPPRGM